MKMKILRHIALAGVIITLPAVMVPKAAKGDYHHCAKAEWDGSCGMVSFSHMGVKTLPESIDCKDVGAEDVLDRRSIQWAISLSPPEGNPYCRTIPGHPEIPPK